MKLIKIEGLSFVVCSTPIDWTRIHYPQCIALTAHCRYLTQTFLQHSFSDRLLPVPVPGNPLIKDAFPELRLLLSRDSIVDFASQGNSMNRKRKTHFRRP